MLHVSDGYVEVMASEGDEVRRRRYVCDMLLPFLTKTSFADHSFWEGEILIESLRRCFGRN